jgi:hypothetical protein
MPGKLSAIAIVSSLLVTGMSLAASGDKQGALPSGTPAGVSKASAWNESNQLLWLLGGGVVIGGIVLVTTGNGHGTIGANCPFSGCTSSSTSTSTTSPTTTTGTTTTGTTTTTTH